MTFFVNDLTTNRTKVELKRKLLSETGVSTVYQSYQSGIETTAVSTSSLRSGSTNRTKVELKLYIGVSACMYGFLPIVPKWNWNKFAEDFFDIFYYTTNRTKVELKLLKEVIEEVKDEATNRTKVELKLQKVFQ